MEERGDEAGLGTVALMSATGVCVGLAAGAFFVWLVMVLQ